MPRYFQLSIADIHEDFWLLWRLTANLKLELREQYRDLVCKKCGKLDVPSALKRGLADDIPPLTAKRDFAISNDNLDVISRATRDALIAVPGVSLESFAIPSMPDHFVAYPSQLFKPPPDTPVLRPIDPHQEGKPFQFGRHPCKKCGRVGGVTFRFEWFQVPENVTLAGVLIEQPKTPIIVWIASEAVVEGLKRHSFSGLIIREQE